MSPVPDSPTLLNRLRTALRLGRAARLVWDTAPRWTLANSVLVFAQGLLPPVSLYLTKRIVDSVTQGIGAPDKAVAMQHVSLWIVVAAGVGLLTAIVRSLGEYASEAQSLEVTDGVSDLLHAQSIAVDLEYYEEPGYYDALHRAQKEAPYRPTRIVNGLIQVAQNSLSLLGIVGLLITLNWSLGILLFIVAMPGAIVRLINARRLFHFDREQTEKERRAWYFHTVLTDSSYAKEVRLFQTGEWFRLQYRELREQVRRGKLAISRRRALADALTQVLATAALFGSLAWIAVRALHGDITVGDLMVYYLGFQSGLSFLQALLRALAGLYEDNLFVTNFYQFLDLEPKIIAPPKPRPTPQPAQTGVAFQDVGFTYPSREEAALHAVNFTIAPGEVVALVGENGSGKTTLIKLLCRLYDPSLGAISVEGVDLRELDPVQWRRGISVIFQDYARYALTVAENIALGNGDDPASRARIEDASRRSGSDSLIRHLPQGYDTMLGHWFAKGQELSVGEWQKIALARAFLREANLIVLDEPTSALDPLAEADVFQQFRELLEGRSAIVISHRFSTVQMADRIYVMDRGRIAEHGTHQQLLRLGGKYAHLYRVQAEHYQD